MSSDAANAAGRKWDLFADEDTGPELIRDPDRSRAFRLVIGGTRHSHVDLDEPTNLEYDYARQIAHLIDLAAAPGAPLRVLHLGAGALTLARYVAATRPESEQCAVDLDGELLDLVRRELPLPAGARADLRTGEAREELAAAPAGWFDMVVTDVYDGPQVPKHLTTVECAGLSKRALRPGGAHVVNFADGSFDGSGLTSTRRLVAGARQHFSDVALVIHPDLLRGRRLGNLVLVASDSPLPVDGLAARTASDSFGHQVLHGPALDDFQGDAEPLTDAELAV
ncbi:fused MFS/spermidine synthase [Catenulispora subtropica]|uniref:Fused MFS/spermidine synthase n=1 Tax=Catenulispora subtropica TaxID=450798 RepID=A0ABP5E0T5_9ACTN